MTGIMRRKLNFFNPLCRYLTLPEFYEADPDGCERRDGEEDDEKDGHMQVHSRLNGRFHYSLGSCRRRRRAIFQ